MKKITLFFQKIFALLFPFAIAKVHSSASETMERRYPQIRAVCKRDVGEHSLQVARTLNSFFSDGEIKVDPKVQVTDSNQKPPSNRNTAVETAKIPESQDLKNGFSIAKTYGSEGFDKIVPWLIKHLIPASSNGILFGRSQSYKTFALVDIACCIVTGRDFSNLPTKHGLVFIVAAEGSNGISKRIRAWELQHDCTVGEKLIVIPHSVFPNDDNQRKRLISEIDSESTRQATPVALIIFDTFSQCSNGISENEAGAVSKYLQSCKSIGEPFGATVINVHHTKKSSDDFRGSSTLVSNVDFLVSMKRHRTDDNLTKLNLEKMKEGSTNYQWDMKLDCVEIDALDEDGVSLNTLCVTEVELHHLDKTSNHEEVKKVQYKIDAEWIKGFLNQSHNKWVSLNELRNAMAEEFNIPVDTIPKMRLDRAKKALVKEKVISEIRKGKEICICLTEANPEIECINSI